MPSLAELRREHGWTASQLAHASNLDEQLILRIEEGAAPHIPRAHIDQIAAAMGVDPSNITEFRPSLGLTAIGETGAGDDAPTGARPDDV